ncbi:Pentatricopeptide repeat-containing protein [Sesamum alatum]|uniref:Pentatricopeptide repeat-containing protein n=1 Tax=Sesamum alatum TaxID=300844 RepID=A0AAE2CNW0_9LAMI|nr:Pentatricopeptide repeat-containing protein [Sesamum alatum]
MLIPSTFRPKYRHRCITLPPLLLKLYFSSSAAQQCISLAEPELVHREHVISGVPFQLDPETPARVLSNYLSSGRHSDALSLLRRIPPSRSTVFYWNNLIKQSVLLQDQRRALQLFDEMRRLEWIPDGYTYPYVFKACGDLSSLVIGASVHALALVSGCAAVGTLVQGKEIQCYVIKQFLDLEGNDRGDEMMVINGLIDIHSGMVEQGMNYFNNMKEEFGVVPEVEHYACMVDLLGRAGRLNEAMKLIKDMPVEPNPIVWVALLSGCRLHGNVELGEHAVDQLLALNFENDGLYTLLSNLYASARRWKDVARIRLLMKRSGVKKRPGCSWVQGKKGTATFLVGDKSHPMTKEIYNLLGDLIYRIKIMGYIPETSFALHDVDDEEKGDLLFEHSEKLALAYAILTTAPGIPIRITKNLRVCGDCHTAITYISRIIEHEVILRDPSRFHHFKNGSCSCKGYWFHAEVLTETLLKSLVGYCDISFPKILLTILALVSVLLFLTPLMVIGWLSCLLQLLVRRNSSANDKGKREQAIDGHMALREARTMRRAFCSQEISLRLCAAGTNSEHPL